MFTKGNKIAVGNKGGGRKTIREEVAGVINGGLANQIANKRLVKLNKQENVLLEEMKAVVIPIVIKGMTDKSDVSISLPIPLLKGITDVYSNPSTLQTPQTEEKN